MSYSQFNRQEILQKAKDKLKSSKERAAEYYLKNRKTLLEKSSNKHKNLSEEEKNKVKKYQRKKYQQLILDKNELILIKQEEPIK